MKTYSLLLCVLLAPALHAQDLVVTLTDGGDRYQFSTWTTEIALSNPSAKAIEIESVKPGRWTDKIVSVPKTIPAHGTGAIKVTIDTLNDVGTSLHGFEIIRNGKAADHQNAYVRNFGLTVLDDVRPAMDFGVVDAGRVSKERTITLASREDPEFRVNSVVSKPDFADVAIGQDRKSIKVTIKADAAWGLHRDYIKLAVSSARQPQVWIDVRADVHGAIVPSSNPLETGLTRQGTKSEAALVLRNLEGGPVQLGKITFDRIKASATPRDCIPASVDCKQVLVSVSDDQPTGKLSGTMRIELPQLKRVLPVEVTGVLVVADAKIVPFEDATSKPGTSSAATTGRVELSDALKSATSEAKSARVAPTPPPGVGPLLKWQVKNDGSVHGYAIYRGSSAAGPFRQINPDLIHPLPDAGNEEVTYYWRDTDAKPGEHYWYSIGTVRKNGTKQALTGPQEVVAKTAH